MRSFMESVEPKKRIKVISKPSIDDHPTPNLEVQVKDNTYYGYLTLNEFCIYRDPKGQARAMDGRFLNISKEEIAEIIAMNGCTNFFISKNRPEAPSSIDDVASPTIDGHFGSRRSTRISIDILVETSTDYSIGISIDALGQAIMQRLNMLTKVTRSALAYSSKS
ncbi:hypothetical protein DY000_02052785 [Brassica cretica]|uniref:Uncharacterized protein n=1 Tax=Brassica cretica TaxID=69181 RepID=A0ABQ7AJL6_BRACR|nr:hypothetical protein DY000_02052785 [Brassica cretica]